MEKFIVLAGSPNSGKTISVNLAINKLISNGFKVNSYFNDNSKNNFWSFLDKNGIPSKKSGSIVLEKEGKKIVLISYGDSPDSLKNIFNQINFNEYHIVICCSHATKGKSVFKFFHAIIGTLDLNQTQVIPIYKNLLSNHNNETQENEQIANLIISLL